jgi:hypothetical protein
MRNHLTSKKRIAAVVGTCTAAVLIVGGATISIAADNGDDGRDPGARPGAPGEQSPVADAPVEAPADGPVDNGRGGVDPAPRGQLAVADAPAESAPADTGRGGIDPAPSVQAADAPVVADVAVEFDTDLPPAPGRATASSSDSAFNPIIDATDARSTPIDQDVPGAPMGVSESSGALPGDFDDQDG